jgi:hypothetical protein
MVQTPHNDRETGTICACLWCFLRLIAYTLRYSVGDPTIIVMKRLDFSVHKYVVLLVYSVHKRTREVRDKE